MTFKSDPKYECDGCYTQSPAPEGRIPDGWLVVEVSSKEVWEGLMARPRFHVCPACQPKFWSWRPGQDPQEY